MSTLNESPIADAAHGYEVSSWGRIKQAVKDAYDAAH